MQRHNDRSHPCTTLLVGGLVILAGCGSGGGSSGGSNGSHAPAFAGTGMTSSNSGTVVLRPQASDGDPGDRLTFDCRGEEGPYNRVDFRPSAADGETSATFPLVGTYLVEVTATDSDGRQATHEIEVTILDEAGFTLQMGVADMVADRAAPLGLLPVRLFWRRGPNQPLLQEAADIQGQVQFRGLADDPAQYELRVPTN
jgi:hypothetical protein